MPIVSSILLYVADKIAAQIIKEDIWKHIKSFFWPSNKYKHELVKVLSATVKQYESAHPYIGPPTQFPFYESQIIFEELSKYILFEKTTLDDSTLTQLSQNSNIHLPTQQELTNFYSLFVQNCEKNNKLKKLFIEENHKEKIFSLSSRLDEIKETLASVKEDTSATKTMMSTIYQKQLSKELTESQVVDALQKQVNRQLTKQTNSGKYMLNTFIETGEHKEYLRYICDPLFYCKKVVEEADVLDFRHLNRMLAVKGEGSFIYNLETFKEKVTTLDHDNCMQFFADLTQDLQQKRDVVKNLPLNSNDKSTFEYKFSTPIKSLKILGSRLALITETAGQGKTNFLCDFAENFLAKRNIPTVFLTGTDIRPDNIRGSILSRILPDNQNFSFEDLLVQLEKVCKKEKTYFVIIIDGLNENANSSLFSESLSTFTAEILEHNFIRLIYSCRTEYYEKNFRTLDLSISEEDKCDLPSLRRHHHRHDDPINEKLFHTYFYYFKVAYKSVSGSVMHQLSGNFLLLRIFCETYQGQSFDRIDNIYKEELFENYFKVKCDEINKRFKNNDDFSIKGNFDIRTFITSTVQWMVQNKTYVNVPLDTLLHNDENRHIYVRFLDENILVRRDIQQTQTGPFDDKELVNFTFDEFRDFLLSRYLVDTLYPKSESEFKSFLSDQLSSTSPILEGCSTFIFYISRKSKDDNLKQIITGQAWYQSVFADCIFNLRDEEVLEDDRALLKKHFVDNQKDNTGIIADLISRFDTNVYKNLNTDFLINLLLELDDSQYATAFSKRFTANQWNEHDKIKLENIIKPLSNILDKEVIEQEPAYHKAYELLLYMFDVEKNWEIQDLYERYHFKYSDISREQLRRALNMANQSILAEINFFIENYEISI